MSRDTLHLAQEQIRHQRDIQSTARNVGIIERNSPVTSLALFELCVDDGALGVNTGIWIRNLNYTVNGWNSRWANTPVWAGAGTPPSTGDFAVWAQINDPKTPTILECYYDVSTFRPDGLWAVFPFPFPTADSCWRALGSFNIATGNVITITAQYWTGLIQDWDYS